MKKGTDNRESSEEIGFVSFMHAGDEIDPKEWVFSTGATVHVCNSRDKFENYRPVSGKHIVQIDGSKVDVAGIGSVTLRFTSGKTVTLTDVVHIPTFVINFVSVGRFTSLGFVASFGGGRIMLYKDKKFYGNGCIRNEIFVLNVETEYQSGA